jgi:hypothetical protein
LENKAPDMARRSTIWRKCCLIIEMDGFVTISEFPQYQINREGLVRNKLTATTFTGGKTYYHLGGFRRRREDVLADAFPCTIKPAKLP